MDPGSDKRRLFPAPLLVYLENHAEEKAFSGLEQKIRQVEKRSILTEFGMSSFIAAANLVLRLGIATTALVGILLMVQGQTDLLTFFFFLLVASRLYDPLDGALQNLSAIISTNTNIQRMAVNLFSGDSPLSLFITFLNAYLQMISISCVPE